MGFKMSYGLSRRNGETIDAIRIGFRIGESFAEFSALNGTAGVSAPLDIICQERWYLPKKSLADGLRSAMETVLSYRSERSAKSGSVLGGGEFSLVTTRVERALVRRQGQPVGWLVTAGFEQNLGICQPMTTGRFAHHPERATLPVSDDHTFGVDERVDASGKILSAVKPEELEFLHSKLELLKIKIVAIGFLHSPKNPENEKQTADFFRAKGYTVFTSHDFQTSTASESERWLRALEYAYVEQTALEEKALIEETVRSVLGESFQSWNLFIWTESGRQEWTTAQAAATGSGYKRSLLNQAKEQRDALHVHFGLEGFYLISQSGTVFESLPVHATSQIELGSWMIPAFSSKNRGYEPGPMLLGKSHQLTSLDILYARDHLGELDPLTPMTNEKSRGRIKEALYTFGKMIPDIDAKSSPDADDIAHDLETALVESIAGHIARHDFATHAGKIQLSGALAQAFAPLLKARRPDLKFSLSAHAGWNESLAAAKESSV
jgi:hypothetical protein